MSDCRYDYRVAKGLTLVEILIAMALMGFISLSISNFLVKSNVMAASLSMRFKEATETHTFITDLQQDLRKGAYISPNSYNQRLEYTTYDATGAAVKKIYRISSQYIQLSTDGGTTWGSPYRISNYNKYRLVGSPKFLYSGITNNCTDFTDTSGNLVYGAGDSAALGGSCPASSGSALSSPAQATKVALSGFQFTTGNGSREAVRSYPGDLLIAMPSSPVRSATTPAIGVKDTILMNSFATDSTNPLYGTDFIVKSVTFDPARNRIFIGGSSVLKLNKIFIAERNGVLNGSAMNTSPDTIQLNSVALTEDGSMLGLDTTAKKIYTFNTSTGTSLAPTATLDLVNSSSAPGVNLIDTPKGIAYDSKTPTDVYIVGNDPGTSALKIYQRNKTTGALVGTAWDLPAAFSGTYPPSGLAIEPTTGDFLVVRNYVNGSSPNKTIDIYRITRAGVSTSFAVNIDDLGSTATGTNGQWGIGYDPRRNRLFLSDAASFKVYELTPTQIISPRG